MKKKSEIENKKGKFVEKMKRGGAGRKSKPKVSAVLSRKASKENVIDLDSARKPKSRQNKNKHRYSFDSDFSEQEHSQNNPENEEIQIKGVQGVFDSETDELTHTMTQKDKTYMESFDENAEKMDGQIMVSHLDFGDSKPPAQNLAEIQPINETEEIDIQNYHESDRLEEPEGNSMAKLVREMRKDSTNQLNSRIVESQIMDE